MTASSRPAAPSSPWPRYEWPDSKAAAFCFSVDVDAEAPLLWSQRDGMPQRLGQIELRRFGPRTGLRRVLALLARYGICGSFYVPGIVAETYPEILPTILAAGHEVGLHGFFHEIVAESSDAEFTEAIEASLDLFLRQTGRRPVGFRSPAWEMTPHMLAELRRLGLLYDSSLGGFDHPYTIAGVTEIPVQWTLDDAVYFRFQGGGTDKWPPMAPGPILDGWLDELRILRAEAGLFMLTIHPWISGRGQRIALIERLLDAVTRYGDILVATAAELARHHTSSPNGNRFQVAADLPPAIGSRRFGQN